MIKKKNNKINKYKVLDLVLTGLTVWLLRSVTNFEVTVLVVLTIMWHSQAKDDDEDK